MSFLNVNLTIDDGYILMALASLMDTIPGTVSGLLQLLFMRSPHSIPIPPYVGNGYFCDTASKSTFQYTYHPRDPLWDG